MGTFLDFMASASTPQKSRSRSADVGQRSFPGTPLPSVRSPSSSSLGPGGLHSEPGERPLPALPAFPTFFAPLDGQGISGTARTEPSNISSSLRDDASPSGALGSQSESARESTGSFVQSSGAASDNADDATFPGGSDSSSELLRDLDASWVFLYEYQPADSFMPVPWVCMGLTLWKLQQLKAAPL